MSDVLASFSAPIGDLTQSRHWDGLSACETGPTAGVESMTTSPPSRLLIDLIVAILIRI